MRAAPRDLGHVLTVDGHAHVELTDVDAVRGSHEVEATFSVIVALKVLVSKSTCPVPLIGTSWLSADTEPANVTSAVRLRQRALASNDHHKVGGGHP